MSGPGVVSSFQKKGKTKVVSIPGTRPSIHNSQLLLSCGIPSLDYLIGGGLPVGSIILIEQDRYDVYSKLFLKYFLAEGVMNNHMLTLASLDVPPQAITSDLPAPTDTEPEEVSAASKQMTIAWRYQSKTSQPKTSVGNRFGHNYDLTKSMGTELTSNIDMALWDGSELEEGRGMLKNKNYWSLLQVIKKRIESSNLATSSNKAKTNVLRLGLHSVGSPLWGSEFGYQEKDHKWQSLTTFLFMLRALVRTSFSVCMVTVPAHLFTDPALLLRLQALADFVVRLESFQGSEKETNPVFKDYHGLFHIVKLAAINSLVPPILDSTDWVFKLKRRKLTIERLHLPPELSETVNRNQEDPLNKPIGLSCIGGNLPKNLDF
ncbi:elongator complex protein 4-like [Homarus americanus]|uniref:Elongator complex protein 4-like n=1 Tax=Homarus americanus TaxID=6706 RepID=A0A8J5N4S4_HOMAM|nr:elongator complex protein 4-like [Homarus americanus]XP_042214117.1 elongator complex protein 4-like [Homarus americanus]KAG7173300.1 Elongator complex protein 4-like [Homarus americanus]